ncbi:hypothetical protein [Bacillus sp. 03113]|uniref:hypothetical protein n=1 Tax=Bacillus sp. 03113 TaxID=2578211 RepID=UPI001C65B494|nr:hypothetical protein [Bacillus sp. 03113]
MFIIDTKLTEDIFIEKLKEGINNQINKLEQEVVELVQEELEDLRENEEFDIDYYNKLEDFWNDYELYPLPAYHYGYYHTLAHEIEEKTNDFIYGLIIETIETIGIDKIRIFLMEQGYEADEVDKMDIQNLDWVLRQVLDLDDKIYEFADSIFYDFGEYEISFFTEDKISKLQELYEQIEKPDNFSSFNQHFENHLNIIKNQIKNLFKENYGELKKLKVTEKNVR